MQTVVKKLVRNRRTHLNRAHAALSVVLAFSLLLAGGGRAQAVVRLDDQDMTETDRRAREQLLKRQRERESEKTKPESESPAATLKGEKPVERASEALAQGWCIIVALLSDSASHEDATRVLAAARTEGRLNDARLLKRGKVMYIGMGNYPDADDERAQSDLKRVQAMEINGQRPYRTAYLLPPESASLVGRLPQYNLARAKALMGDDAIYTLQIAAYGREDLARPTESDLAEARKAAEQGAMQLRRDGEQAFYYHGPRMSMVTVGVFDLSDYDPQVPSFMSSRLREAKNRHEYNLYNGAAIKEKAKGRPERLQPSRLVAIPSK